MEEVNPSSSPLSSSLHRALTLHFKAFTECILVSVIIYLLGPYLLSFEMSPSLNLLHKATCTTYSLNQSDYFTKGYTYIKDYKKILSMLFLPNKECHLSFIIYLCSYLIYITYFVLIFQECISS